MGRLGLRLAAIAAVLFLPVAGCMGPQGDTVASQRQAAQSMRSDTLRTLYKMVLEWRCRENQWTPRRWTWWRWMIRG